MEPQQIKELILKELPALMQQDSSLREWVLNIGRTQFADKAITESRFDQMMRVIQQKIEEDRHSREEQTRQWEENQRKWEENQRKWEENQRQLLELERKSDERWEEGQRKWEANQQVINQMLESIRKLDKKYDQTLGALGTRWGLHSEDTFRNAISGILQEFPSGVEVIHVNEFDDTGEVFGRPDQIELDLIIRNGKLLIAEIKSSMSRGDMYLFERKARFYERRHQRTAHRLIVISPMVDKKAQEVAAKLEITVYSYTDEVELTE
ncbi:hypothetical protein THII_3643 [Thioploca ingrica]|uniref:DUF3782 domain-containing protein n=1 Tax=Thioploca ingrica TaxID=40754 RepID=A0A090AQL4_9GAMM|nr:hypothetical protein THII_3643 [Thioploca ingrica]